MSFRSRSISSIVLSLAFLAPLQESWAAPVSSLDFTIHQEYASTRALGMGNAFTAVVNDHSAIFYNPAALARRKKGLIHMFVRAGLSNNYLPLTNDIGEAQEKEEPEKSQEIANIITAQIGEHFYSRIPTVGGMWVRPNWGIALIPADLSVDIGVHQQVGPTLDVTGYLDTTLAYSYAHKIKSRGKFSWGITLKALHRVYAGTVVSVPDLVEEKEIFEPAEADEGLTVDADIGFLYTPKLSRRGFFSFLRYMEPTFSFVARNVVDYGFPTNFHLLDKDSGEPPKLQRRFDVGSNWDIPNFWVFDPHIAIDIRDMGHRNWNLMKGVHAGMELYWTMFNWWKGHWSMGLNQGYPTLGFGARFAWFQLDIATWGEEVGTEDHRIESRRIIAEMSLDF